MTIRISAFLAMAAVLLLLASSSPFLADDVSGDVPDTRIYTWSSAGNGIDDRSMTLTLSSEQYSHYNSMSDYRETGNIAQSIDNFCTYDDPYIVSIAEKFRVWYPANTLALANDVLHFVQKIIVYTSDTDAYGRAEYWKYPYESLYDRAGDCEDSSFLYACIMKALGFDVVIFILPSHAAVGVAVDGAGGYYVQHDGKNYYFCETTCEWPYYMDVGESTYEGEECSVYYLDYDPDYTFLIVIIVAVVLLVIVIVWLYRRARKRRQFDLPPDAASEGLAMHGTIEPIWSGTPMDCETHIRRYDGEGTSTLWIESQYGGGATDARQVVIPVGAFTEGVPMGGFQVVGKGSIRVGTSTVDVAIWQKDADSPSNPTYRFWAANGRIYRIHILFGENLYLNVSL